MLRRMGMLAVLCSRLSSNSSSRISVRISSQCSSNHALAPTVPPGRQPLPNTYRWQSHRHTKTRFFYRSPNKDESALRRRRPPSLWHARLLRRIATAELGTFSQRATPARCGRERSGVSRQKRRAGRRQGDQGGAAEAKREWHAAPVHPVHPAHPTHPAHPPGNRSNARGGGEGSRRAAYRSCFASAAPSPPPSLSASLCSRHRLPSLPTVIRLGEFFETGQIQPHAGYAGFTTED